ncbi:hypothetical protein Tco_0613239 [Tanacetum coccineum]
MSYSNTVKVNLRRPLGLGKWASVFVNVLISWILRSEIVVGLVLPLCSLIWLSSLCYPKDSSPDQVLYLCRIALRSGRVGLVIQSLGVLMEMRLPFYCTPPVAVDVAIPDPTLEDLATGTPSTKVLAKAEASKKQKASLSLALLRAMLPTILGPSIRDSWGKAIMTDAASASSGGAGRPWPSSAPAPSVRDFSGDAIHRDLFPFSLGLDSEVSGLKKKVTNLNDKLSSSDAAFVKAKTKGKDQKKMIKSLSKNLNQLTAKVARLSAALNQATVLEAERDAEILRLKAYPYELSSFFQGGSQSLVWKFLASDEFSRVQGELLSLVASAGFERGLNIHRTQEELDALLKKISHFVPGAQGRLAKAS